MTRSKLSDENAGEKIGQILERFRLSQGWRAEDDADHDLRVQTFLEILGAAQIPVKLYDRLYRRAIVARGIGKAGGAQLPFFLTPEELIAQYKILVNEEAAPKQVCPNAKYHLSASSTEVLNDLFGTGDEIAPCPYCRRHDYEAWRKTQIALYGEVKPAVTFSSKKEGAEKVCSIFGAQLADENLSDDEIGMLLADYHQALAQIADYQNIDRATYQKMKIIYDEGARIFRHPHNAQTFSAKDMRRKIADYQKIIASYADRED